MVMVLWCCCVVVLVLLIVTVMVRPVLCSYHIENVWFSLPVKNCKPVGNRVYGGDVQWLGQG